MTNSDEQSKVDMRAPLSLTVQPVATDHDSLSQLPSEVLGIVVAGVLSEHSRRAYMGDIRHFLTFLTERDIILADVRKSVLVAYRAYLARGFAPSTVNRRLTVARRLITEAWELGYLGAQVRNPADGRSVAGLKDSGERGKPALSLDQARELLRVTRAAGDLPSLRDTAILHILLGTGLRRSELATSRIADLQSVGGHTVLSVQGKGNKRRAVKLIPSVAEDLTMWLSVVGRHRRGKDDKKAFLVETSVPIFSPLKKLGRGDNARWVVLENPLSGWGIWSIVRQRIQAAGLDVDTSPHGLRATFITLALEAGATLSKVQDAAGHKDPRTTDRYRRRKANLDDNAADYVKL